MWHLISSVHIRMALADQWSLLCSTVYILVCCKHCRWCIDMKLNMWTNSSTMEAVQHHQWSSGSSPSIPLVTRSTVWAKSIYTHLASKLCRLLQVGSLGSQNWQAFTISTLAIGYAYWSDTLQLRWPPILFAGVSGWESDSSTLVLIIKKIVNIVTSIVLATTPLYENISRRWVFYYMVCHSML